MCTDGDRSEEIKTPKSRHELNTGKMQPFILTGLHIALLFIVIISHEKTDAGIDRLLCLINKLYDKTLKSQNYYSNILRFPVPWSCSASPSLTGDVFSKIRCLARPFAFAFGRSFVLGLRTKKLKTFKNFLNVVFLAVIDQSSKV